MKLGEMLVRDGRLEPQDLERVVEAQAKGGGRIGSLLVLEGLIDVETLTVYLGLELGIPIANGATFERCKASAVRLLSPEQASRFRCIPIVIQGQTLIVAVDDPHDMQTLDEIAQATGYRVLPRVAPEIRIFFYLERFYGVRRPPRFSQVPDQQGTPDNSLPAPPLPGLPPKVAEPTAAPTPAPPLRTKRESQAPPVPNSDGVPQRMATVETEEHEALELDAADLVEELEADEEASAQAAPRHVATETADKASPSDRGAPTALTLEEATAIIEDTQKRGDIADAILGHAAELFEVATLLLVRDNFAFGWKGFGPGLNTDRIETLLMPLEPPSIFRTALDEEQFFQGRVFPNALHSHWYRVLRCATPNFSVVTGCAIGSRVVNLLYGHTQDGKELSDEDIEGLQGLMNSASQAYVRLISKSKREHKAATMNPELGLAKESPVPDTASDNRAEKSDPKAG